jgi:hypothetical protein
LKGGGEQDNGDYDGDDGGNDDDDLARGFC